MCSAVTEAVIVGSRDALSDALSSGGNPDDSENSISALLLACIQDREDLVRELLRYGASTAARDPGGATALHSAASIGSSEILVLLLAHGADANSLTAEGQTPLMRAAHSGHANAVRTLFAHGADPGRTDTKGRSALHWAVVGGDFVDVCAVLIEAGADPFTSTHEGITPMQYAVSLDRVNVIDLLSSLEANEDDRLQ
jgi:ankyrin repeat protein